MNDFIYSKWFFMKGKNNENTIYFVLIRTKSNKFISAVQIKYITIFQETGDVGIDGSQYKKCIPLPDIKE